MSPHSPDTLGIVKEGVACIEKFPDFRGSSFQESVMGRFSEVYNGQVFGSL